MGRLLRLLGCSALAAAGVAVALAAAGPGSARSAIPCPLEPAQTITTPCCGPPVLAGRASRSAVFPCCICCGPVTVAHPTLIVCLPLTISSSPDPSIAGQNVTLTGRWSAGTSGVAVTLWEKRAGSKAFVQIDQTTTGAAGQFQFVRPNVVTNRQWYVSASGVNSFTIEQQVRARVSLGTATHGLGGRVFPNHAGEFVAIQRHRKSGWGVIARLRITKSSKYTFGGSACNTELRAVLPADKRNIRSVSGTLAGSCGSFFPP